jgi:hypothetical protein
MVNPRKSTPPFQVRDLGLVLVEHQALRLQPFGKPRLDLFGLLADMTQGKQVVGISG